jgi:hypothetical protein
MLDQVASQRLIKLSQETIRDLQYGIESLTQAERDVHLRHIRALQDGIVKLRKHL